MKTEKNSSKRTRQTADVSSSIDLLDSLIRDDTKRLSSLNEEVTTINTRIQQLQRCRRELRFQAVASHGEDGQDRGNANPAKISATGRTNNVTEREETFGDVDFE